MILITGATGFVGRSVTNLLSRQGREWKAYRGRINNPATLQAQLEGVEAIIHLAGSEVRGRNRLLQHVDVEGTERLLEVCRRLPVQRLVVPSRIGADANASHALLQAKGEMERLVQRSGVPYTILRSATLFGRGDRFSEVILALAVWSWPFVWLPGGGANVMQPLWVEDFARCLVATLDRPDLLNTTITIAGEEPLHYREIAQRVLLATGHRRIPFKLPLVLLRPLSRAGFGWWYRPAVSPYFADRFFVPEVAAFDSVLRHFSFRPARMNETLSYLRRPGLRWRLLHR